MGGWDNGESKGRFSGSAANTALTEPEFRQGSVLAPEKPSCLYCFTFQVLCPDFDIINKPSGSSIGFTSTRACFSRSSTTTTR